MSRWCVATGCYIFFLVASCMALVLVVDFRRVESRTSESHKKRLLRHLNGNNQNCQCLVRSDCSPTRKYRKQRHAPKLEILKLSRTRQSQGSFPWPWLGRDMPHFMWLSDLRICVNSHSDWSCDIQVSWVYIWTLLAGPGYHWVLQAACAAACWLVNTICEHMPYLYSALVCDHSVLQYFMWVAVCCFTSTLLVSSCSLVKWGCLEVRRVSQKKAQRLWN